jgi:squalene synthase HpnC
MTNPVLEQAYAACQSLARRHYENFPVGSWLLPRAMRRPVTVIYAFARTADDLADEGDHAPAERLAGLQKLADMLDGIAAGTAQNDFIGRALADVIDRHRLPIQLFHDLLDAFRQDVTKTRYENFGEIMDYCRRSANPIGRLLLQLHGDTDARHLAYSDAICSALQLINFYQDLHQDYAENGRIYIPRDELHRFDVREDQFRDRRTDFALQRLMQLQYERAQRLLSSGAPLARHVRGRFGFELRLIVLGGHRVLQQLMRTPQDAFARPRLKPADWLWMALRALRGQ